MVGSSLLTQLDRAIKMRARHEAFLIKHSERYSPEVITKWECMVQAWEDDMSTMNPYAESSIGL